jgi:methylenetetrahydrofolate dehydrogenase (NADP+)/methenyltetrahydrofolate cyclohydrolase
MRLIDGRAIAAAIRAEASVDVVALRTDGVVPTLAILVPTCDEATAWYVRSLVKAAAELGFTTQCWEHLEPDAAALRERLAELSLDDGVHGIVCQTPLPDGMTLGEIGRQITPAKDVDGANPASLGRLALGLPAFAPATAQAVVEILHREGVVLRGRHAVVVGRSPVVGKPLALLLLSEDATVTICHTKTADLAAETRRADVLVAAAGRAGLIGAGHVKPGAVVIDVGTNPTGDGSIVGDVDAHAVEPLASVLTPVPGGVGPVTTALLLRNVATAALRQSSRALRV